MEATVATEKKSIESIFAELEDNQKKNDLINHPFLREITTNPMTMEQLGYFIGQWYHLLEYFSPFLSRTISETGDTEVQTFLSRILYQELGEGNPARSHLGLFIRTFEEAGINRDMIMHSTPNQETRNWVDGHKTAAQDPLQGLGFVYGTEMADLAMVSAVGRATSLATGNKDLPWVDIHILQEPDHVESVNHSLGTEYDAREQEQIVRSAENVWQLWSDFFSGVQRDLGMN